MKLVCFITLGLKDLIRRNTPAYQAPSLVTKKMMCCKYRPSVVFNSERKLLASPLSSFNAQFQNCITQGLYSQHFISLVAHEWTPLS
jgi:hypothetical protein